MNRRCTTIDDAWQHFCDLHGSFEPLRTKAELRAYIHAAGRRYEELDADFWETLFLSEWPFAPVAGSPVPAE